MQKLQKVWVFVRNNIDPVQHDCPVNWKESSGAMEASMVLDLTTQIFNKYSGRVYIKNLVSDDDSTLRSLLQHHTTHAVKWMKKYPCQFILQTPVIASK